MLTKPRFGRSLGSRMSAWYTGWRIIFMALLALVGLSVSYHVASSRPAAARAAGSVAYQFPNVRIGPLGYIDGLVINPTQPSAKFVRTDVGGAYRWNAATSTWTPLTDLLNQQNGISGIESIATDPSNPSRLYIAAGQTVYRSNDQGDSWSASNLNVFMGPNSDWRSVGERLNIDPNDGGNVLFFGSRRNGLFRSQDAGQTWSQVTSLPSNGTTDQGISFIVFDKRTGNATTASQTLYVGVMGKGVYKSTNGGTAWTLLGGPKSSYLPGRAVMDTKGDLFVTYTVGSNWSSPTGGAVYKFPPSGKASAITPVANQGYNAITISPVDDNTLVVGSWAFSSGNKLYQSSNGGANWTLINATVQKGANWWADYWWSTGFSGLMIDPENPSHTWVTDGFSVWRTDDNSTTTQTWVARGDGIEELVTDDIAKVPNGGPLLVATEDVQGFSLHHWTQTPIDSEKWEQSDFGNQTDIAFQEGNPNYVVRTGGDGSNNPILRYATDGGNTWQSFPSLPDTSRLGGRVAVSATNANNIVYVGTCYNASFTGCNVSAGQAPYPYYTTDGGASWHPVSGLPQPFNYVNDWYQSYKGLVADPQIDGTFYWYAGQDGNAGSFYRSQDGGATWAQVSSNVLPAYYATNLVALPGASGDLWLSFNSVPAPDQAKSGLWHSTDGGVTWTQVANFSDVNSFGFGKAAVGQSGPALYVYGTNNGQRGLYISDDATSQPGNAAGATWQILTSGNQGVPPPILSGIFGDRDTYGVVYVATGGRGVICAEPVGVNACAGV